jgi:ACS family hexuronate transporter-like MFS transporter
LKSKHYRWRILSFLFFATTINYIDRQIIGILKPFIEKDPSIGFSEADYGLIVSAFQISYAIGLLLTGRFLDKFGIRIGYFWAVLVWSLAAILHAAAIGFKSFAFARAALGLGESANFPASVKTVAEWFPKKERAFAIGIFNSGSTVGAIAAPIIVSAITISLGWRWAFIITGSFGFIWIAFWLAYYKSPLTDPKITSEELAFINQDDSDTIENKNLSWTELLTYKQTYVICFTRFISDWVWGFFLFWIPDYLNKNQGINLSEMALPLILIYSISSLGGISGGWVSSKFIQSGRSIDFSRKFTIFLYALLVLPLVFIPTTGNIWIAVLLIALASAGHQGWASNLFSIISDIYPKNSVGSMMGVSGFIGAIGAALSAVFVGLFLQSTSSYDYIFVLVSVIYLVNWLIIKIFISEIKPVIV